MTCDAAAPASPPSTTFPPRRPPLPSSSLHSISMATVDTAHHRGALSSRCPAPTQRQRPSITTKKHQNREDTEASGSLHGRFQPPGAHTSSNQNIHPCRSAPGAAILETVNPRVFNVVIEKKSYSPSKGRTHGFFRRDLGKAIKKRIFPSATRTFRGKICGGEGAKWRPLNGLHVWGREGDQPQTANSEMDEPHT